ncbi:type II CRISPR-associated endonuclease Cas1 [Massilia sp. W12]|uniref:type II CRISPR-associated endonuclease Cas1 n=1 Tax=Massilia sp. W12 TaxID=3126507 RepID=UPI0030D5E1F2
MSCGRIVEVADDRRHLSLSRGFMQVHESGVDGRLLGQIPLDDIAALIAHAHGLTYTNNLLVALAERGAPFVLCGANHMPVGMLLSLDGHYLQGGRIDAQLQANLPLLKRLWAEIVKAKLQQQACVLASIGQNDVVLLQLARKVKAGDPDNLEAQGARKYWQMLFGPEFRRNQEGDGENAALNYGYTVLRACAARAVVAAGLHPSIGLHHSNDQNPMRLVDDLMEPFRPMIDLQVLLCQRQGLLEQGLTPELKRKLVNCLYHDMQTAQGVTPMMLCIQRLATSLAQVFCAERDKLELPLPGLALDLAASLEQG